MKHKRTCAPVGGSCQKERGEVEATHGCVGPGTGKRLGAHADGAAHIKNCVHWSARIGRLVGLGVDNMQCMP